MREGWELYLPFNFAVNLELLLRDKVYSTAERTKAKKKKKHVCNAGPLAHCSVPLDLLNCM